MRNERIKSIFWLSVIASWISGLAIGKWYGRNSILIDLSKAVRVPTFSFFGTWWEIILYFTLSTVAIFVLSHILFGIGGAVFLFARGIHDSTLLIYLEDIIQSWSVFSIPMSEVLRVIFVVLIFAVNIPLSLWSGKLGIQSSIYTLNRIKGEPVSPDFGSEPLSKLLIIVSASLVTGFVAALIFHHL
ncbi:hypothetical protein AKJ52_02845 [candidate division MSBL1 archaeon SCGC-AAA382C18]|uniref:Uncharacterized protein n=1 Tax=candidate division MSBL1 archaeon SCGC-AAA382C18 TaxID=1698281 RepID=A0A133VHJ8_9EURY|nr:hypothetical protein AKJ52_02845 [candidate division MSBL1 archaeon SCGC-AAA382C18]